MRDSLNMLFRERFQGHETPVDPSVWQGIQQYLAQAGAVAGEDGVSKLFKERFQGHESAVDPAVWQCIGAQLGHTAVATTTAGSSFLGWAAAGVVAVVVGSVAYLSLQGPRTPAVAVVQTPTTEHLAAVPAPVQAEPVAEFTTPSKSAGTKADPLSTAKRQDPLVKPLPDAVSAPDGPIKTSEQPIEPVVIPAPTPKPTTEGVSVVESIIADITTEVKQQVLEQQSTTGKPDNTAPVTSPEEKDPEIEFAPMPKLFVPNTFTPNGDGKNDEYQIGSEGYSEVLIKVYSVKDNRLVFSSTNSQEKWLGTNCEDGMYLVAVEARTPDGRTATEGKVVWLNRIQMN